MWRYLIRRILWAIVLFIVVTFVTFVIFFIGPSNPARTVCGGEHASGRCITEATKKLGLDQPVYVQYWYFFKRLVFHGSLGTSFIQNESVNSIVGQAAPVTASLVFGGAILWLAIGLTVGILSALRPRSLLDRVAMIGVLIGVSAHPVWIGYIFSFVFGYKLGITPIAGYAHIFNAPPDAPHGLWPWFYHMILPWCTFAVLFAALYVRMIRANVMETMNEDFVRTARAKGAPESQVLRSHVLRNALMPVVTMLGMDIGVGLAGAVFTEGVYSLPGLGLTAINAIQQGDLAITQGIVVFATISIIVFNLIVDLLYAWIDPRIRLT
jgi:peptide/nickel transport system permease protein